MPPPLPRPRYLRDYSVQSRDVPIYGRYIILPARLHADEDARRLAQAFVERLIDRDGVRDDPLEPHSACAPFSCLELYDLHGGMRDVIWCIMLSFASANYAATVVRSGGDGQCASTHQEQAAKNPRRKRQFIHASSSPDSARAFLEALQTVRRELEVPAWKNVKVAALLEPGNLCINNQILRTFPGSIPERSLSCRSLLTTASCRFKDALDSSPLTTPPSPPDDIEELINHSRSASRCPYYALNAHTPDADIVFTTYAALTEIVGEMRLPGETLPLGPHTVLLCDDAFAMDKALSTAYKWTLLPRGLRLVGDYVREREALRYAAEATPGIKQYERAPEQMQHFARFIEACIELACNTEPIVAQFAYLSTFIRRCGLRQFTPGTLHSLIMSTAYDMLFGNLLRPFIIRAALPSLAQLLRFVTLLDSHDIWRFFLNPNQKLNPFRVLFRPDTQRYPLCRFPGIQQGAGGHRLRSVVDPAFQNGRNQWKAKKEVARTSDRELSRKMDLVGFSWVPAAETLHRWKVGRMVVYGTMTPVSLGAPLMPVFRLKPMSPDDPTLCCRFLDHGPPPTSLLLKCAQEQRDNVEYRRVLGTMISNILTVIPQPYCVAVIFPTSGFLEECMVTWSTSPCGEGRFLLERGVTTVQADFQHFIRACARPDGLEPGNGRGHRHAAVMEDCKPVVLVARSSAVDGLQFRIGQNRPVSVVVVVGMAFAYADDPAVKSKQGFFDNVFGKKWGKGKSYYFQEAVYQTLRPFLAASGCTASPLAGVTPHRLLLLLDTRLRQQKSYPLAVDRSLKQSTEDYTTILQTTIPAFLRAALHRAPLPTILQTTLPARLAVDPRLNRYLRTRYPVNWCGKRAWCGTTLEKAAWWRGVLEGMERAVAVYEGDGDVEAVARSILEALEMEPRELHLLRVRSECLPWLAGIVRFILDPAKQDEWARALNAWKAAMEAKARALPAPAATCGDMRV
ncbi:regulator of telomere elongation helicase 1 homolog [Paramacrobiotus metropolitanus]|uniref:regulator of telomere elongation helicase 1 homolog n=1 Tax=Paramacrobiotus metropolitanus TaxID=2943436 RepID=UPI002445A7A6|nr:regulator of telomere elongation helicase 1 homolog [Paramacrobiotus metropolitanus]